LKNPDNEQRKSEYPVRASGEEFVRDSGKAPIAFENALPEKGGYDAEY
jgi:hypothetical protein